MTAITLTYDQLIKLDPCNDRLVVVKKILGGPRKNGKKVTAAQARKAGVPFDDILWAACSLARKNDDVDRRLRLWKADCAAHVLHIYEKSETSDAPRKAITAARRHVRGKISEDASAAAGAAAWAAWAAGDAARDAAWHDASAAAWAAWGAARAASAAWAAAWAARDAAWAAARAASAARGAARAARGARGARGAAGAAAEKEWQLNRLVAWLSAKEPKDWPLPKRQKA